MTSALARAAPVIRVLDASTAVKWFSPDRDAGDAVAARVLRDVAAMPTKYVVPELFAYEMMAVLCRRIPQASDAQRAVERLTRLGLRRLRSDEKLTRTAVRLAYQHRLTGYDATYAALAMELRGTWLTWTRLLIGESRCSASRPSRSERRATSSRNDLVLRRNIRRYEEWLETQRAAPESAWEPAHELDEAQAGVFGAGGVSWSQAVEATRPQRTHRTRAVASAGA